MSEKNANVKTKKADAKTTPAKDAKVSEPKVEILRGRMPLPIVHMIKFGTEGETDGAVATKFRTTNGKVSDVRKDRNFGYVTKAFVPTADMIAKATEYADQLDDKSILKAVKALVPSTPEQDAEFAAVKASLRPSKKDAGKKDTGKPADDKAAETVSDDELAELTD